MQSGIQQGRLRYEDMISITTEKTTAISKLRIFIQDQKRLSNFFFSAHKGFQETAVM